MDGLNYWWNRFQAIRKMLKEYREYYKLKDVEECIVHLLEHRKLIKVIPDKHYYRE